MIGTYRRLVHKLAAELCLPPAQTIAQFSEHGLYERHVTDFQLKRVTYWGAPPAHRAPHRAHSPPEQVPQRGHRS